MNCSGRRPPVKELSAPVKNEKGVSVIMIIATMLLLSVFGAVLISLVVTESDTSLTDIRSTQAHYIAQGGIEFGIYTTTRGGGSWTEFTITNRPLGAGSFTLNTYTSGNTMILESVGVVDNPRAERKLRVVVEK